MSPSVEDQSFRNVTCNDLVDSMAQIDPTPADVVRYFNNEVKERAWFLDGGMG